MLPGMNKKDVDELFTALEDLWLHSQALVDLLHKHGLPSGEDVSLPYRIDPDWRAKAHERFLGLRQKADLDADIIEALPSLLSGVWMLLPNADAPTPE
jgi:hypothetical protein